MTARRAVSGRAPGAGASTGYLPVPRVRVGRAAPAWVGAACTRHSDGRPRSGDARGIRTGGGIEDRNRIDSRRGWHLLVGRPRNPDPGALHPDTP